MRTRALIALVAAVAGASCGSDATTDQSSPAPADPSVPATADVVPAAATGDRMRVIVDYSPTSSDVAALMYVTQHPAADLVAVTLAGTGESHCAAGVANTRALLTTVGLTDVPVACGPEQPVGPGNEWPDDWRDAADRLDGLDLQTGAAEPADGPDAADLLASIAADGSPATIIALAPLTNLAVAIERYEDFSRNVAGVVTMGGAVAVDGNAANGFAEWNYFIDPSAVDVVLRSGIPVTMVPLDATDAVPVTREWFELLAGRRTTAAAAVVHDLFAASRPFDLGFFFWDELAAATAFDHSLVTFEEQTIAIQLDGTEHGRTFVDPDGTVVRVAIDADRQRFETDLLAVLNGGADAPAAASASPDEVEYFASVEDAVAALSAPIEEVFESGIEEQIDGVEERVERGELTAEDEDALRTFMTDLWTTAAEHLPVLSEALRDLDPPASVQREHDAYLAAIDAVAAGTADRLADIDAREGVALVETLWEPDAAIEAMNAACEALATAGSRIGVVADVCP